MSTTLQPSDYKPNSYLNTGTTAFDSAFHILEDQAVTGTIRTKLPIAEKDGSPIKVEVTLREHAPTINEARTQQDIRDLGAAVKVASEVEKMLSKNLGLSFGEVPNINVNSDITLKSDGKIIQTITVDPLAFPQIHMPGRSRD